MGTGSFQLTTADGNQKVYLFNYEHIGTPLSRIDGIAYDTYRSAGAAQQVAALNLEVDANGAADGGFTTLVFEPVYNATQGVVTNGTWQHWDAVNGGAGRWWSSNPIEGLPNRDTFKTWAEIIAANPNAIIQGGVGVNQGSGNPNLVTNVDAFSFDETTYDLGPTADDCKSNGWQAAGFKNQGDCVSFRVKQ